MSPISISGSLMNDNLDRRIRRGNDNDHSLLRRSNKRDGVNRSRGKRDKHSGDNEDNGDNGDKTKNSSSGSRNGNSRSSSSAHSSSDGKESSGSKSTSSGKNSGNSGSDSGSNGSSASSSGDLSVLPTSITQTSSPIAPLGDQTSMTFAATPTPPNQNTIFSSAFTTSSSIPAPSPTSEGSSDVPVPSPPSNHSHALPLGSIVAIILGVLFCITISAVIYIFTKPKIDKLRKFWKQSEPVTYPPYPFPNAESAFAHKEMGYGYAGSIYRPIYETSQMRPVSQSFATLRSFRFGGGSPSRQGSEGRFTQFINPLPVARTSTRSKSSKGISSGAMSYRSSPISGLTASTKEKSWYSHLGFEYPPSKYPYKTSVSDESYPGVSQGFEQNRIASPSFPRSSMSSFAIDRQTIIIPYRSSGQLEDVSEQETMSSGDERSPTNSRH